MSWLHRFVRRQLWWYAAILAAILGIGWASGSRIGWNIVHWTLFALGAGLILGLAVAGWTEWQAGVRARNDGKLRAAAAYALGGAITLVIVAIPLGTLVYLFSG